jgi:predicted amidohydrolase YtcJ
MDVAKVRRRGLPRIGGCFATALDGCFGSVDAALREPYADDPANRSVLFYYDARVADFARQANRAGLQIEVHAIGDAAFDQAVGALAAALADHPRTDHRHTIIHACLPTDAGLDRCAELGVALAVQPAFLDWPLEPQAYLERVLGDRAARLTPLRDMARRGLVLSGGSDAPCTLPDPVAGIHAACNHPTPGQSLTVGEALRLFTWNAAWTSFDEKDRGSLEAGKIADLAVLSADPHAVPVAELGALRVEQLLLAGRPYASRRGLLGLAWDALRGQRRIAS